MELTIVLVSISSRRLCTTHAISVAKLERARVLSEKEADPYKVNLQGKSPLPIA